MRYLLFRENLCTDMSYKELLVKQNDSIALQRRKSAEKRKYMQAENFLFYFKWINQFSQFIKTVAGWSMHF